MRRPGRARSATPKSRGEKDLAGKLRELAEQLDAPHADPICAKLDAEHATLVRQVIDRLEKSGELVDKTWQEACDAELERCDEEYKGIRDAVIAFDAVVLAGETSWDKTKPPRLQGCSVQDAADFAHRVRKILDAEPRLKALDVFEAHTGLKIEDERLARLDARAVRALHEEPGTPHNDEARSIVPVADFGECWWFWCQGCDMPHSYRTKASKGENRNGGRAVMARLDVPIHVPPAPRI